MTAVAKQPAVAATHIFHKHVENDASDCRNLAACDPLSVSSILRAVNPTDRLVRVCYRASRQPADSPLPDALRRWLPQEQKQKWLIRCGNTLQPDV